MKMASGKWIGVGFLTVFFSLPVAQVRAELNSPFVSGNALFLYRNTNYNNTETTITRNGVDMREAELAFYADVDPYSRLSLLLSVHPNYTLNTATNKVDQTFQVEPEEAYAESTAVPGVNLKLGIFKAAFGKASPLHTHAFPMIEAPLVVTSILGDEGLKDPGVSGAALLPVHWFSEVTVQYLRGKGENSEFNSPLPNDAVGLLHWKNLVDINDDSTLELGASFASGKNSMKASTSLGGADVTWKWRPSSGGKYRSAILGLELIARRMEQPGAETENGDGGYLWGQYQWAERWKSAARFDQVTFAKSNSVVNSNAVANITTQKAGVSSTFEASEFSEFKFEYDQVRGPVGPGGETLEHRFFAQANFTIGAHPAHGY